MSNTILVTGATGTVGLKVVAALAGKAGVTVRVAVRDAEGRGFPPMRAAASNAEGRGFPPMRAGVSNADEAKALTSANVVPVEFDYTKPETLAAAVKGADRVFVVTPFTPDQVELGAQLIDAAKAANVRHLVKLSALGCEMEPGIQLGRWHRATERNIEASGIPYTFLRPNNFMDNFLNFYPPAPDGAIYLPLGEGAVSYIDARDIAAVAALALTSEAHYNQAYALTGGEALTVGQAAAQIAEATGRAIRYVDVPEDAARKAMLDAGAPAWMVDPMAELNAIGKAGYAAGVSPLVHDLTGQAPRTFAAFAREHAAAWQA